MVAAGGLYSGLVQLSKVVRIFFFFLGGGGGIYYIGIRQYLLNVNAFETHV